MRDLRVCLPHGLPEASQLPLIHRQGFFNKHMLSGPQSAQHQLCVGFVPRQNRHRVDTVISQQLINGRGGV